MSFRDPAGIAPPGEDPDAYPGNVPPQLALVPPDPKPSKPDLARQVFDAYLEARASKRGGGHAPVLSDKRKALVKARLKDHPFDQLIAAARGIWSSEFHVEKGFTEFDLAMRDAEHVERFAALAPKRKQTIEEFEARIARGELPRPPPTRTPEEHAAEMKRISDERFANPSPVFGDDALPGWSPPPEEIVP